MFLSINWFSSSPSKLSFESRTKRDIAIIKPTATTRLLNDFSSEEEFLEFSNAYFFHVLILILHLLVNIAKKEAK